MDKQYDMLLFAGQSNMAGRGITSERWKEKAPISIDGSGFEYRAVSDPGTLHKIEEPFGANENKEGGIYEPGMKTGSLVTSFINSYYKETGTAVIAVSASKGGSSILEWQDNNDYLTDALKRLSDAKDFAMENAIDIRHCYLVWCQGETDGDRRTSPQLYAKCFENLLSKFKKAGVDLCFMIAIGQYNGAKGYDYEPIRKMQLEIASKDSFVALVSDDFSKMKERGLMKDDFHYYQKAYNEVGEIAGKRAGQIANM